MTIPVDVRPDHLRIVQDILHEHLPRDVQVCVFGSRANWTTKDSSDLDLALEGKSKLDFKIVNMLEDAFEESALPYTVDVVDINRVSDHFRRVVESQKAPFPAIKRPPAARREGSQDDQLHLSPRHREKIEALLREHLPDVEVWAYGSRVNGRSHDGSDLDLVLRGPKLAEIDASQLAEITEALRESTVPFLVEVRDWARLPESFHREIERDHVVLAEREERDVAGEWPEASLGECTVINDSTYSPKEAWSRINYLDTGSISENRLSEIRELEVGKHKIPSRARRKVQPGDIVYSTVRPNQRHFGLLKNVPENFLASTGFAVVRGRDGLADTGFIYWFLAQDHIVEFLHSIAENSTSAYPSIRPSDLAQLTLSLPPLPQQRAIAHILGTLDDKIELNRRMNETLEAMARALFKSWFVDFEPVRAKMEDRWRRGESSPGLPADLYDLIPDRLALSELGEIPEGWEVGQFGKIVTRLRDNENPTISRDTLYSHFSIPAYDEDQTPKRELGGSIKSTKSRVFQDTVLLSKLNPEVNRVWLVDMTSDERAICSTEFLVLKAKPPFQSSFVYCLCLSPFFRQQIESIVTGTSKSHQRAPANTILSLKAVVPPARVVEAFETSASGLLRQAMTLRRESRVLAAQRDTLLPSLVSGDLTLGCYNAHN